MNLDEIVNDIRAVRRTIDAHWDLNVAPLGVKLAAEACRQRVDMEALDVCVAYLRAQRTRTQLSRGIAAAHRLHFAITTIRRYQAELTARLRAAA